MFDVEIRNFQSIAHITARVEGFTVLVGRSNIGKSAVVRTIKCALTNPRGTDFVRHNPKECARILRGRKKCECFSSVHIKKPGLNLLWEKGDSRNKYVINDTVYTVPGMGTPEFLSEAGFSPVKIGDKSRCIQVADQFHPIFLLDQSGPSAAEAVSDVARLERINVAIKLVDKDRREIASAKKLREEDAKKLREGLKSYDKVDEYLAKVREVSTQFVVVGAVRHKVELLDRYTKKSYSLVSRIQTLWQVGTVPVPDFVPVQTIVNRLRHLYKYQALKAQQDDRIQSLAWVESLSVPDSTSLTKCWSYVHLAANSVKRLRSFKERFARIDPVIRAQVPDIAPIEGSLLRAKWLSTLETKIRDARRYPLDLNVEVPELHPLQQYQAKVYKLLAFCLGISTLKRRIEVLQMEFQGVNRDESSIQEEIERIGYCPTCEQPIQPDVGLTVEAHQHV